MLTSVLGDSRGLGSSMVVDWLVVKVVYQGKEMAGVIIYIYIYIRKDICESMIFFPLLSLSGTCRK